MPRKFGHRVAKDGGEVEYLRATPPSAVQGPVQNTSVRGAAELPLEGPRLMGGVGPAVANQCLRATPPSAVQGPVQNTSVRGAAELPSEGPRLMGGVGPAVANLCNYGQPQPNVPQSSPFLKRSRTVPRYGQGKGSGKGPGLDKVSHCNISSSCNGGNSATDVNGEPAASPQAP